MNAVDKGGTLLTRAKLILIFRGSGWTGGLPNVDDATTVFNAVTASPYFSFLTQYRGIRRPEIVQTITDPTDFGNLGPDPRGFLKTDVWRVADADIRNAVKDAMKQRPPADGEDTYYLVFFSKDPLPVFTDQLNAEGYHSRFDSDGRTIVYGAVLNWSANTADNIWNSSGSLPAVFGHEVVEACTDPHGDGFLLDTGDELADLADTRSSLQLSGLTKVISLAAYWSELNGAAFAPTSYSTRVAFGVKASQSLALRGVVPSGVTVRNEILSRFNP